VDEHEQTARPHVSCPDRHGIVAAVAGITQVMGHHHRGRLVRQQSDGRGRNGYAVRERTSMTVGEVARLWLERGTGQKGRWAPSTLEGYERIVRRHIEHSTDPSQRPLGTVKLRELSIDRVARWSQANERALAPTTAVIALER